MLLRGDGGTGYIRVDWFTPDGLPTWGDGRLTILGTDGYIELRKYVDIGGRPGGDHLFLVDRQQTRYIDCRDVGAALRATAAGRRPPSHRDGDAPGARVSGLRARARARSCRPQRVSRAGGGSMTATAERLRVAVVGVGIGRSHLRGYARSRIASTSSPCATSTPSVPDAVAEEHGVSRVVTDLAELLRMDDVDVVDICTPPHLHFDQIQQVLDAGKHAICEKPLVSSLRGGGRARARRGALRADASCRSSSTASATAFRSSSC